MCIRPVMNIDDARMMQHAEYRLSLLSQPDPPGSTLQGPLVATLAILMRSMRSTLIMDLR